MLNGKIWDSCHVFVEIFLWIGGISYISQELGELEEVEEGAIKIAKKKMPKVEENKSKKEHVNVVFIGHVGE